MEKRMGNMNKILCFLVIILAWTSSSFACETSFEGFGVHLGALHHLNETNEQTVRNVIDKLYFGLQLRHFRTSYEPYFSPTEGVYDMSCNSADCYWVWNKLLQVISEPPYNVNTSVIASIWSPPYYMKDLQLVRLKREYEGQYYHFIKNITQMIQDEFGIVIEAVSPVNEPENVFAPWDHCNMDPLQLCRMVSEFNDSLISICPENSYFWISQLYTAYKNAGLGLDCLKTCSIVATHAYALNINPNSENFLLAYYDLVPYQPFNTSRDGHKRIWQTEVSSTWRRAHESQMEEGLDLATNILNFLGVTCIERYYFWSAYTNGYSGESLIWGTRNEVSGEWDFTYPKKYFIYNHFTNASAGGSKTVSMCTGQDFLDGEPPIANCLKFDEESAVIVNKGVLAVNLNLEHFACNAGLCCTNEQNDLICFDGDKSVIPPLSVCSCRRVEGEILSTTTESMGVRAQLMIHWSIGACIILLVHHLLSI